MDPPETPSDHPDEIPKVMEAPSMRSKNEEKKSLYITVTRAKAEYYLTDSMIRTIGEEDKLVNNPHYRRAAPMRLYLIERIETWVSRNIDLVLSAKYRREKLSKIQRDVHERKRVEEMRIINEWVPVLNINEPLEKIMEDAKEYYTDRYEDFDGALTQNGLISYIRHQYTDYGDRLYMVDMTIKKRGMGLYYLEARNRINPLIDAYLKEHEVSL
jgi:hypothetical protein